MHFRVIREEKKNVFFVVYLREHFVLLCFLYKCMKTMRIICLLRSLIFEPRIIGPNNHFEHFLRGRGQPATAVPQLQCKLPAYA